jgi:hypothetical protein
MSNTDTDFIILDENPVYANPILEFIQEFHVKVTVAKKT